MKWIVSLLTWLGSKFGGSSKSGVIASVPSNGASLPSLPTGSVAAAADAVTEVGRLVEQQTNLRNTPVMQQAAIASAQEQRLNKLQQDISNENTNATRNDLAD